MAGLQTCAPAASKLHSGVLFNQPVHLCRLDMHPLLSLTLPAGSFLNAGNKDGAASGFQVDALLRLKDVRSTRARCAGDGLVGES